MKYISTRGNSPAVESAEAIRKGLAPDGGLYVPESIPSLSEEEIVALCDKSYEERAAYVLGKYLTDYTADELTEAAKGAYAKSSFGPFAAPVSRLGNDTAVLELWHGPTCAFKDMALQIMPRLLSLAIKKSKTDKQTLILVATSGDTGKAALEGYKDIDGIKIMVFYPNEGVSDIQKLQMASQKGNNVNVYAISGNFDDAQTGVKTIFSDKAIAAELDKKGYVLSSANSINWGRLAPQIAYYVSAYCDLVSSRAIRMGETVNVCVPTGNFGNILAGYYAKRMGLPIDKLICASNSNNVLTDFIATGTYDRNRDFHTTMSPSMDILISSNLERLLYLVAGAEKTAKYMKDLSACGKYTVDDATKQAVKDVFEGYYASESDTAKTIKNTFDNYHYLSDPHTAVALYGADKAKKDGVTLVVSTASPYKFSADVLASLGKKAKTDDYFDIISTLETVSDTTAPKQITDLKKAKVRFRNCCDKTVDAMTKEMYSFLN